MGAVAVRLMCWRGSGIASDMSALGHKWTFRDVVRSIMQNEMSALCQSARYFVCFWELEKQNKKMRINACYSETSKVTVKFARARITSATLPGHEMYYAINQQLCFVCYRVADRPTPKVASRQQECACCRAMIWVARKSPAAHPKICIQCVQSDAAIAPISN